MWTLKTKNKHQHRKRLIDSEHKLMNVKAKGNGEMGEKDKGE